MILTHGANSIERGLSVEIGGRTYPVVKIGNQYWLAENLAYHTTYYSFRYPNGDSSNESRFGLLYNYDCITEIKNNVNLEGFRFPTKDDIDYVYSLYGSNPQDLMVSSSDIWNGLGTNTTGFSAIPSGSYNADSGNYLAFMQEHIIFTDTFISSGRLARMGFGVDENSVPFMYVSGSAYAYANYFSIRLVKD